MNSVEKIQELVLYLNNCTKAYDEGNPIITDEEYDNKYFELKKLEEETNFILSNSPTQSIPYDVVNALSKVEHSHKMLSLDKTKSLDEVGAFLGNHNYLIMCKMDGLTCSLTYKNGDLVSAETRGNGFIGEDILHNALHLRSIPKSIPYKEELVIDGEIICTYDNFEQFSSEYKNPRNFASGSIRLLNSKECAARNLTFVAWDVITSIYSEDEIEYRVDQKLELLSIFGFTIVPYCAHSGLSTSNKVLEVFVEDMKILAAKNGYPIDGVVFKFSDCEYGRSLGETTHHFKNALAYKFYDEVYASKLIDIEWTMGRTGVLTPVAVFEPIDIDGSTVERASLHNVSIMEELFYGTPFVDQQIEVFKANMIIPQIYSAEHINEDFLHYPDLPFIDIPKICPVCGGEVKVSESFSGTKELVCFNSNCLGKLINRLDHFCGKKGLDIKGLSKATLEKLIDWNWVHSCEDLFNLTEFQYDWVRKPGFGTKSVEKVLNAIETATNCELHQFIAALGIPLIGTTASKELAKHFGTWDNFVEAAQGKYAFFTLPNFGSEMHNSIINFDYSEACDIAKHYIHFNAPTITPDAPTGADLNGKVFVITGKLSHFRNRDEIKARIEALGGKVTGSVSKNTNYLINNDVNSTSSKNMTAKSLGIPILSEVDFIETFGIE
jgi:DNA ligase (NAD+)